MKTVKSFLYGLVLGALFPISAHSEWAFISLLRGDTQPAKAEYSRVAFVGSAQVEKVNGAAERLCGIDCWEPLDAGLELKPGDVIRNQDGAIILKMRESQSFVKVAPFTVLRLVPFDQSWDRGVLTGAEQREGFAVRGCRGKAFFKNGSGRWEPVLVNSVLPETAVLKTEPGTIVDLFCTTEKRPARIEGARELRLADGIPAVEPTPRSFAAAVQ